MALSPAQHQQLFTFLRDKWKRAECPRCDANDWLSHAYVQLALSPNAKDTLWGGPSLPTAALVCQNCSHTELVNLIVAGVVKPRA